MINPALKAALLKWHKWNSAMSMATEELDSHLYGHANTERIAALEEIRKMVEKGEFDDMQIPVNTCGT